MNLILWLLNLDDTIPDEKLAVSHICKVIIMGYNDECLVEIVTELEKELVKVNG